MDVTVGTDIPFNTHMAAYASLAQGEHTTTGEEFLYPRRQRQFLELLLF
jgi:uncharacterized protein YhjY with autotransporter beta-barrel domain